MNSQEIKNGDVVRIKPDYQDPGDDKITFKATSDEDKGRVIIQAQLGLPINPTHVVKTSWIEKVETPSEFIAMDFAGWNQSNKRFTHVPSGKTLVRPPHASETEWHAKRSEWFSQWDSTLNIHDGRERYSPNTKIIGTVEKMNK